MGLPDVVRYQEACEAERGQLQEMIVAWWLDMLAPARTYDEAYRSARFCADVMRGGGFNVALADEDGESMVAYLVATPSGFGATISVVWDAAEGVSLSCAFSHGGRSRTLVGHGLTVQEMAVS